MPELGWVRLSEGALEHLLDHLVKTRHSGFGVIEYRDISNVASALWEIKDHNLKRVVIALEPEEESRFDLWAKEFKDALAESEKAGDESTCDASGTDVEQPSGEALAEPSARSAEAEKPKAKNGTAVHKRTSANRKLAEEAGFTLDHFESMLREHGLGAMATFLDQSKMTAGNVAAMSRREGYPIPSAVKWLKHLACVPKVEAEKVAEISAPEVAEKLAESQPELQVQSKGSGPTQVISYGRARELCRTGKGSSATELRFINAFKDSGLDAGTFIATLQELHGMAVIP